MDRPSSLGRRRGYKFGLYLKKELILQGTIWMIYLLQLTASRDPRLHVASGCYGHSITLNCLDGDNEIIVVHSLKVGSKQKRVNCTENPPPKECCTMNSKDDCVYDYKSKVSSDKHEFRLCQGKSGDCPMKVLWAQNVGKCSNSKYPSTTQYMVANYMCANKYNIMDMCGPTGSSSITSNSTVHLRNYLYPNLAQSNRNCLCNISTTNNQRSHTLKVTAVDVLFNCSQSFAFSDQSNALKKIACEKAFYGLSNIYSTESNKPDIHMRYQTNNESSIYLWVEISVEGPGKNTIQVVCRNMSEEYRMPSELAETTQATSSTSKGTTETIHTTTQQKSASSSSYLEVKVGENKPDAKLIGGVTAGLFLLATLIIVMIFVWKRRRNTDGGAEPLRYSTTDTNPYDNFNDNRGFDEAVYDTIHDSEGSEKSAPPASILSESVQNHAYESLKSNGYARTQGRKAEPINDSSSGTSLPKEPAPLPPTPDLFRRLPSLPKGEDDTIQEEISAGTFDIVQERMFAADKSFLESARTSTQTVLETLTASNPDLTSRGSLSDNSLTNSGAKSEYNAPGVTAIDESDPKESPQIGAGAANEAIPTVVITPSTSSNQGNVLPSPEIYYDTQ